MENSLFLLYWLLIKVVFGALGYLLALDKGRNRKIGLLLGFVFDFWAIIGYMIVGDSKEKKLERAQKIIQKAKEIKELYDKPTS